MVRHRSRDRPHLVVTQDVAGANDHRKVAPFAGLPREWTRASAAGYPITLKFAGRIGDILTTLPPEADDAADESSDAYTPLPFWHYV